MPIEATTCKSSPNSFLEQLKKNEADPSQIAIEQVFNKYSNVARMDYQP